MTDGKRSSTCSPLPPAVAANWVAVRALELNYHRPETIFCYMSTTWKLNKVPEQQPSQGRGLDVGFPYFGCPFHDFGNSACILCALWNWTRGHVQVA